MLDFGLSESCLFTILLSLISNGAGRGEGGGWASQLDAVEQAIPDFRTVWAGEGQAVVSQEMMECFWKGDAWLSMVNSCCKTLYLGPGSDAQLQTDLAMVPQAAPAKLGLPVGVRYSYFLGHGNDIVVNGGGAKGIEFLNYYFGWNIHVLPLQQTMYRKQAHTYRLGDPTPPPANLYEFVTKLPEEIHAYEGMTVVDTTSLPDTTTVVMDNWPSGQPTASPAFISKYCEVVDSTERLNQGLPMKVTPSDCPALAEENLKCACGHVVFLGWKWEHAHENVWDHSLVAIDDMVKRACGEPTPPPVTIPRATPPPPPPVSEPPKKILEEGCREAPEYDPAAKRFFYWMPTEDGGQQGMVRHWCQSDWVPQEEWYRFQRYLPEQNNNKPPPPINDYDFLNAYAPKAGNPFDDNLKRLGDRIFDDFTLGNTHASYPQRTIGYKRQPPSAPEAAGEPVEEQGPWMSFDDRRSQSQE